MDKKRVLFVCVHNSARSQMAEVLLKHLAADKFEVESAGLEPGTLNSLAVSRNRHSVRLFRGIAKSYTGVLMIHLAFKGHGSKDLRRHA